MSNEEWSGLHDPHQCHLQLTLQGLLGNNMQESASISSEADGLPVLGTRVLKDFIGDFPAPQYRF
jgi:hypothetical protein